MVTWLCSQVNAIWQLLQRDLKYWKVVSVLSFFLSLYCQHNMGLMDGPLASISENGIAFGVRIKHGKGQNKTKQNKNTHPPPPKKKPSKQKRKLEPTLWQWNDITNLNCLLLVFSQEKFIFILNICIFLKDISSILIFCYLESNLILTNPEC